MVDLENVTLEKGTHKGPEDGMCAMELVSYIARGPFTDHPQCASPVLGAFLRSWNDALDDDGRQRLKPFLPRVIGTAGDGKDEARAWLATDWLVRVCAPAWLELAGVEESPAALRGLPPITAATRATRRGVSSSSGVSRYKPRSFGRVREFMSWLRTGCDTNGVQNRPRWQ